MNYYERHLGDYAKDTKGLSMLQHGAYNLLLDCYYSTESGIAQDEIYTVTSAVKKAEREAVDRVLKKYFSLVDGVWIKNRVEEEIEKYQAGLPAAEEKRENEKERQRRARERRKSLSSELKAFGVVMPWNTSTADLEAELSRLQSQTGHKPVTPPVTRDNTATRHQTPDTRHQKTLSASVVVDSGAPLSAKPEQPTLGKIPMRLEWTPNPDILAGVLFRAGAIPNEITPVALNDFREYFSQEQAVYTETQWCQKLLQSARRHTLKNPPSPDQASGTDWITNEFCEEALRELDAQRTR
jgi:uncharacterized protein YdaU (DUF1376 family)